MMKHLHETFNSKVAPAVAKWARHNFRTDDDAVQECIGLAWKWCLSLAHRGKDGSRFASAIARFAVRAYRSGRRVCGQLRARDAMSPRAWWRHGFTVEAFPEHDTFAADDNPMLTAMADHGRADPADHAAFRIDWPRFLALLSDRDRQLAEQLGVGEPGNVVARKFAISPGRVTQVRQRLIREWAKFHGEAA
jgi:hypothetical protein